MHIGYASQSPHSHFWLIVGHGVETRADELGVKLTLLSASTLDQQIEAINTLIAQRVDVLLIGPSRATGLAPYVARARSAGIPVVVLAAELQDCQVDATVCVDHRRGAELAAAYVVEHIGGHGVVAQILGPRWMQDNIDRAEGMRHIFSLQPGIELVFEQESPDWQPSSGAALTQAALEQFPNLQAVCCANDTLAMGALQAIAAAGRTGQIVVTGFDAIPEALIAIHEGRMGATINQPVRAIGRAAVDVACRLVDREAVPPLVLKEVALVTRDSLTETALEIMTVLPGVLQDAIERGEALAQARQQIILSQQAALRELSTPLIPLSDEVLLMPLIGMIDALRAQQILETLLQGMTDHRAKTVIMDITGVQIVDTHVANALIQAAQAVRLLGARVVLTGIRPEVAQTLVGLGVDLGTIVTYSSLQSGIANTLRQR